MRNKTFAVTSDQIVILIDFYNALVAAKQYRHTPAGAELSKYGIDYITVLLNEYRESFNSTIKLGDDEVIFAIGIHGTVAIYRHGFRRKITVIAPDAFWDAASDDTFKALGKFKYLNTTTKLSFNLEHNPGTVANIWN